MPYSRTETAFCQMITTDSMHVDCSWGRCSNGEIEKSLCSRLQM